MPYGLRNSFSSSILASTRRSLVSSRMEARRRPAQPGFLGSWMVVEQFGARSRGTSETAPPSSGYFASSSPSNTVAAHSGRSPTIDRTLSRWDLAVGQAQHVVEEAVLLVPHPGVPAQVGHRRGDPQEVLGELQRHVLRSRDRSSPARRRFPSCSGRTAPSRRCRRPAPGSRRSAAARCDRTRRCCPGPGSRPRRRCAGAVLAVDPPGEVQQQLLKAGLEPVPVSLAVFHLFQAVGEDGGPGMHRRVDVAEVPLVGGNLAVGVHVALAQHQLQLLLAEIRIHKRQGEDVEGEIPGGVPGILPLVRHGDDVAVVHVVPVVVARRRLRIALNGSEPRSSSHLSTS